MQIVGSLKKVIAVVIFTFFVIMIGTSFAYRVFFDEGILKREQDLRSEFQSIVHPASAHQLKLEIGSKIIKRWLIAIYKYDVSDEAVERYYENELTKEGWKKTGVLNIPNKRYRTSIYEKGLFELSIGTDRDYWIMILNYNDFYSRWGL